jgi:hypothetical protein
VTDNDGRIATDTTGRERSIRRRSVSIAASAPQAREAGLQAGAFTVTATAISARR